MLFLSNYPMEPLLEFLNIMIQNRQAKRYKEETKEKGERERTEQGGIHLPGEGTTQKAEATVFWMLPQINKKRNDNLTSFLTILVSPPIFQILALPQASSPSRRNSLLPDSHCFQLSPLHRQLSKSFCDNHSTVHWHRPSIFQVSSLLMASPLPVTISNYLICLFYLILFCL